MNARCNGRGYPECRSCVNRQHDPFQCDSCDDGSNYEAPDDDEEVDVMSIDELRVYLEAA